MSRPGSIQLRGVREDSQACRFLCQTEDCQFGWLRGSWKLLKGRIFLVAGARYVPNTQFLSIPFRSELIHSAAQVSELSDCTRGSGSRPSCPSCTPEAMPSAAPLPPLDPLLVGLRVENIFHPARETMATVPRPYNLERADRIACSCGIFPKWGPGSW